MKYWLIVVQVAIVMSAHGQSTESFIARLRLLAEHTPFHFDTTGLENIPEVSFFCEEHAEQFAYPPGKTALDFFHVVDLNSDGRDDLIYSGPCLPYDETAIFLNEAYQLRLVYQHGGKILSIEKRDDASYINFLSEAIGCSAFSDQIQVTIDRRSLVRENRITFYDWPPIHFNGWSEIKVGGTLRSSPDVNDAPRTDGCSVELIVGNQIVTMPEGSSVIELARNNEWRFVLFYKSPQESFVGWVKLK